MLVRAAVLAVAVACLGLTMCHSERSAVRPPSNQAVPQAPQANPAPEAAPAPQAQQASQAAKPAAENPPPKLRFFPATKAAGPLR